jgi:hypothetical protein
LAELSEGRGNVLVRKGEKAGGRVAEVVDKDTRESEENLSWHYSAHASRFSWWKALSKLRYSMPKTRGGHQKSSGYEVQKLSEQKVVELAQILTGIS